MTESDRLAIKGPVGRYHGLKPAALPFAEPHRQVILIERLDGSQNGRCLGRSGVGPLLISFTPPYSRRRWPA